MIERKGEKRVRVTALAAGQDSRPESRRRNRINLAQEHLGFATPPEACEAAKRALDAGATHYTTRPGLDPLRAAVSEKLRRDNGITVDPKAEVLITCGAQEALFVVLHVLLSSGDEVIVPQPANPTYAALVRHAHGTVRFVPGDPTQSFELDLGAVRDRLTKRTRALILSAPSVPAGYVPDEAKLQGLAELAVDRNLIVISDESYEPFMHDGFRYQSIGSLPGMAERTITINGFSVPYAMQGWRVGYVAGPRDLLGPIMQLKQALSICSPAVSQYAALGALTGSQDALRKARQTVTERRDAACSALDEVNIRYIQPSAGPFILLSGEETGLKGVSLARYVVRESDVSLAPGSSFGRVTSRWLRLTLAEPPARLREAACRLGPALSRAATGGTA